LCAGERSSSMSKRVASCSSDSKRTSSILPLLRNVEERTEARRWRTSPSTSAPAVSARRRSSVKGSAPLAKRAGARPARIARSRRRRVDAATRLIGLAPVLASCASSRGRGRDLELVGNLGQVLEGPVRASVDHILDPNAQVARGVIETRLHGEERARRDAVAILGRAAQVRPLVDLEADPVPQAVDVALLKPLVLSDRLVSALLEEIADLLLVHARGGLRRQRVDRPLDGLAHERVELLELGRRAPDAERAGHVEVVASARLDRVEVDHDRSP